MGHNRSVLCSVVCSRASCLATFPQHHWTKCGKFLDSPPVFLPEVDRLYLENSDRQPTSCLVQVVLDLSTLYHAAKYIYHYLHT